MRSTFALLLVSALALGAAAGCSHASAEDDSAAGAAQDLSATDRAAIMDGLRATVKPELNNQDVVFNVQGEGRVLRVEGSYAWIQAAIQLRNGTEPTTKGTVYEEDAKEGIFDGFRLEALLKKQGNGWVAIEHGIGSTDVWYEGIDARYPDAAKSIFPWHDADPSSLDPSVRMSIMNALRAKEKPQFANQDIVFNVKGEGGAYRVSGDWAWLQGQMELRTGGAPSLAGTAFANDGLFDGFHVEALFHKVNGKWTVVAEGVGSTDVWWDGLWDQYPEAPRTIFPLLDNR